jgi:hypothetical protein
MTGEEEIRKYRENHLSKLRTKLAENGRGLWSTDAHGYGYATYVDAYVIGRTIVVLHHHYAVRNKKQELQSWNLYIPLDDSNEIAPEMDMLDALIAGKRVQVTMVEPPAPNQTFERV